MSDMSRENNMEEILSSIRRVMEREDSGDVKLADAADDDAVLELTGGESQDAAAPGDNAADTETESASTPAMRSKKTVKSPQVTTDTSALVETEDALIAGPVAQSSRDKLSALSALIAKPQEAATPPNPSSGQTVDALVRDALRPLLKDWLDANLPDIVESMVAKEISRITGRNF